MDGPVDRAGVRDSAEAHLRALVGRDDVTLREDQWTAIEALAVDKRRSLVVQRTGWGKSAVYFVATLLLREQGASAGFVTLFYALLGIACIASSRLWA
eukprot:gene4231-5007_t